MMLLLLLSTTIQLDRVHAPTENGTYRPDDVGSLFSFFFFLSPPFFMCGESFCSFPGVVWAAREEASIGIVVFASLSLFKRSEFDETSLICFNMRGNEALGMTRQNDEAE